MTFTRSTFCSFMVAIYAFAYSPQQTFAQQLTSACNLQELTALAERDDHAAQFLLGRRYYEGSGGAPKDVKTAIKWFQTAGQNGSIAARLYLSVFYKDAEGVEKSEDFANQLADRYVSFFNRDLKTQADNGDAKARAELDGIYHLEIGKVYYHRGTINSPKDSAKAVEEFKLSSQVGNDQSLLHLCVCYLDGSGVDKDEKQANEYFTQYLKRVHPDLHERANQGNAEAKSEVDTIYHYELGLIYWDNGHSWWLEGRKKAIKHFEAAAAKHHEQSLAILSTCYREGFGVPKDETKAASLSRKWNEVQVAENNAREQVVQNQCDSFLAAYPQVRIQDLEKSADRWRLIDTLINFQVPAQQPDGKAASEKMKLIEDNAQALKVTRRDLAEFQEFSDRAARSGARLSQEGIRQKIALENQQSQITARISLALDGVADDDFVKRIVNETDVLPGQQRSLVAAAHYGTYSFRHVGAVLWQSRRYGLVVGKTVNTDNFSQMLQKIRYGGASDGIASTTDSERLLVAGLLMHEVSRIIDDEKRLQLTEDDKERLNGLLSSYRYVLEHAAAEHAEGSADKNDRAKDTRAAFAFSWNACRALVGK